MSENPLILLEFFADPIFYTTRDKTTVPPSEASDDQLDRAQVETTQSEVKQTAQTANKGDAQRKINRRITKSGRPIGHRGEPIGHETEIIPATEEPKPTSPSTGTKDRPKPAVIERSVGNRRLLFDKNRPYN